MKGIQPVGENGGRYFFIFDLQEKYQQCTNWNGASVKEKKLDKHRVTKLFRLKVFSFPQNN